MRTLAFVLVVAGLALPALAQQAALSLQQVERKYPRMSIVHIEKCDYDGDGSFTRTEQICVANLYRAMYVGRN